MNEYQITLWNDLSRLVETSECFYYADRQLDDKWYRIFLYRLGSYSDFCLPNAFEARGNTFEVTEEGKDALPIRFVSHLFPKFFNKDENPFTMNLDLSKVVEVAHKADGSLVSTFTHNSELRLKTKGALESDQAIEAMQLLTLPDNKEFKHQLSGAEKLGYTVMMEFVAPTNRIVLGYEKPDLIVLGIRNREDGTFVYNEDVDADNFPEILSRWTKIEKIINPTDFLATVPDMSNIEGFVCRMEDGMFFKLKTTQYCALHHTKDSINCPRRLYEAVLEEGTDDMRSLFHDDPVAIKMIEEMELFVDEKYNHLVDTVERFYERIKHMERKEYAILGQKELTRQQFSLAMQKYTGKEVNYKDFMKRNWKHYGIKDEKVEVE